MGSNPCRILSLLGFTHPIVGSPFQVQVQCRQLTRIWDESRTRLYLVLFLSCIIFEHNQNMYTFFYQRDCKETVIIVNHRFFVYSELDMHEWVSVYETCECDIGAPDNHRFPRVDGLSTGPPG